MNLCRGNQRRRKPKLSRQMDAYLQVRYSFLCLAFPQRFGLCLGQSACTTTSISADDPSTTSSLGVVKVVADGASDEPQNDEAQLCSVELQTHRCTASRYRLEEISHCTACIRKAAGEACRFQHFRFLIRDRNQKVVGTSFGESQGRAVPTLVDPSTSEWNTALGLGHVDRIKVRLADILW